MTLRAGVRWLAAAVGAAAGAYAAYVGVAWCRYGRAAGIVAQQDADPLLDWFMPVYEVGEHHRIHVAAPAAYRPI